MIFSRYRFPLWAALCALLAAFMLSPGLGGGFIFDDRPNIQENGALHVTQLTAENLRDAAYSFQPGHGSRPLSMLSFALDHWRAGGLDPKAFKLTNLVIHTLTALALALLLRRLLKLTRLPSRQAAWTAIAMAALWAVHPLQVSSVLYVVQRMQTLSTLFVVLALWAYLTARQAQIEGVRSRIYFVLTGLFAVLALAAKEDAILLPAYAFVLELTVLRFRAADPALAVRMRRGYLWATVAGFAVYVLVILPHYWSWDNYPGRTFSSFERLLTQGRVLVMYLGQILLPLPDRLPFFYDELQISRGLWDPPSTLPALGLIAALLMLAWRWRNDRPVFACGVLLFFAGHVITSNVINLEMAFEHRNQLPLVGVLLAAGDLCFAAIRRWGIKPGWVAGLAAVALVTTGAATLSRSYMWGEPLRFAQYSVDIAPRSERAWLALGGTYADFSGLRPNSPYLQKAIETCERGAQKIDSALLLSNVVSYRTIQGTVTQADWQRFHQRLERAPMTQQNRQVVWTQIRNAKRGIPMDERGVLDTMKIVSRRATFSTEENLQLASYVFSDTQHSDEAFPYLKRAVEQAKPDDPLVAKTFSQLHEAGRDDWVEQLSSLEHKAP
ncbi:hypothetical protein [Pseudoxanthomonas japonensis]|uniref:Tetratricopeptide repeat protein n=1 Tax=Pseudoxanthomonas japonensis TaxID=69284 RepID=A0ABQ6ZK25_9GAMM|nr:hypothetical protein [Pseudoxanthomonas japonensis]KAF1726513.1 hypothetical protein CSC78_05320 [Pseudoxanthomonas japonensis]